MLTSMDHRSSYHHFAGHFMKILCSYPTVPWSQTLRIEMEEKLGHSEGERRCLVTVYGPITGQRRCLVALYGPITGEQTRVYENRYIRCLLLNHSARLQSWLGFFFFHDQDSNDRPIWPWPSSTVFGCSCFWISRGDQEIETCRPIPNIAWTLNNYCH